MNLGKTFLRSRARQLDSVINKLHNNSVVKSSEFSLWTLESLNKELKKYGYKLERFGSLYCFKKRLKVDVKIMFTIMIVAIICYLATILYYL